MEKTLIHQPTEKNVYVRTIFHSLLIHIYDKIK